MRSTAALPLAIVVALAVTPAVHAQDRPFGEQIVLNVSAESEQPTDQIVLRLESEGWVETQTARVVAVVQTVIAGDSAQSEARGVPAILEDLAAKGDWRVVHFDRRRDASGLERWRITAETRLPEAALAGLYDRAKSISKPGRQVDVVQIDFTPTLAEREETAARLRADIYRRARAEAEAVAVIWPQRGFRVQRVDFDSDGGQPRPMPVLRTMAASPSAERTDFAGGESNPVTERMVVGAVVVLAASKQR